jgi:hypothetical protein
VTDVTLGGDLGGQPLTEKLEFGLTSRRRE